MEQFLALKASAGSGKTFALTVRYISLLLLNAKPSQILTLTFTNKAASQMKERIYDTLINLGDDKAILSEIVKQTNLSVLEITAKKRILLDRFTNDELAIYTIDKFVNKILRQFSGYVGINDDFSLKFDDEELLLYKFLGSLDEKGFDTLISFAHSENKKLNSIVELFKILIDKNELISPVKYSYEAYGAVKEAILEDANIIKNFVQNAALSKSALNAVDFESIDTLLDKGKTWLVKDSLGEYTYFKKAKTITELDSNFETLKRNIQLYYHMYESFALDKLFDIFNRFKEFRENYNKKRNALEFSDITNIVYKLLENHIEKDFLYFRLDSSYDHILIDEFQDTSTLQFKILYHLIDEIVSGDPQNFKTFFYVGDVKQSIYRFRGGQKELFDYVANSFSPNLKVELLDTNYRSAQNVVKFVNDIFLKVENYPYDIQKVKTTKKGYVEVDTTLDDLESILEKIHLKVIQLHKAGVDYNNIAILTYTNKDVLNIYEYLNEKLPNIKIATEMTSLLINQTSVKAIINGMKYLYFKEDIYKANFNSMIGRDIFSDFEFGANLDDEVFKIVKEMVFYYEIASDDTIKLIEQSRQYDSIVDFVYDIDKLDATVASKEQKGLQILTIFKSKGLEFDSVIVCDRITKKNPDRSSLLFEYEDIELKNIFYKRQNRQNLDSYYANATQKEEKLKIDDELNILYVALTRAVHNMIIVKKDKNSVYDILGELYKTTIGEVYIRSKKQTKQKDKTALKYTPLSLGFQDKTKTTNEDESNIEAKYFGIATHYCLELMVDFTKESLEKALYITKNRYSNYLDDDKFKDIKNRIEQLIANQQFKKLIESNNFIKEQSIIYKGEHKIIDLLIKTQDGFNIIDYKTTLNRSHHHIAQVKHYKNGIKKITSTDNIEGYLVYLHQNSVEILKV